MATYQDRWINGQVSEAGYRECSDRYAIIRAFCERYDRPFTVCDVGANMCYFGLRLTEDFPQCTVVAFEFDHFDLRASHLRKNQSDRVLLINRKLTVVDCRLLASFCTFDVVLALSVLHHMAGTSAACFEEWLAALKGMGSNLIAEFAVGDSPRAESVRGYAIPPDAELLGAGESHMQEGVRRPIVLMRNGVGL